MKITEIAIFDHKQFKNFVVDLTYPNGHPKVGQPLDKVCFIGSNGTGKTTILELLRDTIPANQSLRDIHVPLSYNIDKPNEFTPLLNDGRFRLKYIGDKEKTFGELRKVLVVFIPAEAYQNQYLEIKSDFDVSLNDSLGYFKDNHNKFEVSNAKANEFWKVLTYQVKKREDDYQKYLKQTENRNKTVAEVEAEFDRVNPKILDKIAILWNQILDKAGLEFDAEGANNPIQLTDNLKAYIRLKSSKQPIPYNELSTGIRNFIFKVGHIYSLYFNRNIESGFLMIDEPENSLFPDFLYDIVSIYQEITQNTQIFMATHSPIIAAQFEPCERIILNFDEDGYVIARKGIVPVGDDPNDILIKDFGIRSLLGKEGVEKWERFIELKFLIKAETNIALKAQLINEYMEIGKAYNFGLDLKLKQDEANYQKA